MEKNKQAYDAGYEACLMNKDESANPYDLTAEEAKYLSWNDGWIDCEQEEN